MTNFLRSVEFFMEHTRHDRQVRSYGHAAPILPPTRTLPVWTEVEMAWESTRDSMTLLLNLVSDVHRSIADLIGQPNEEMADTIDNLANVHRRLTEAQNNLAALVSQPDPNFIYWAEIQPMTNRLALQIAPLHISPLMDQVMSHANN